MKPVLGRDVFAAASFGFAQDQEPATHKESRNYGTESGERELQSVF